MIILVNASSDALFERTAEEQMTGSVEEGIASWGAFGIAGMEILS